jgi:prepilin-type processing-associated H-X9-DG protein
MESDTIFKQWDFLTNGFGNSVAHIPTGMSQTVGPASTIEIKAFYCPTRRSNWRTGTDDNLGRFATKSGGTDYGGCAGRVLGWTADGTNHAYVDCSSSPTTNPPLYNIATQTYPAGSTALALKTSPGTDSAAKEYGMVWQANQSTGFQSLADGTSNTLMVGELQRITNSTNNGSTAGTPNSSTGPWYSHDGWCIGGDATLFSTAIIGNGTSAAATLMNNGDFRSPGSDHSGTVNFGLGDGSVRSLSVSLDACVFALLGSMADRVPAQVDN